MTEVDKLKIEVFNLREQLQMVYNQSKMLQQEIEKRVLEIRNLETANVKDE